MPNQSNGELMSEIRHTLNAVAANQADLAFLVDQTVELTAVLEGAEDARKRQDQFKGQVQQATRDLEAFLKQGQELLTRIRNGIRTRYGLKSEKLAEFGMQPRRPPQRKKPEEQRKKKGEKPPEPAPPTQTASNKSTDVTSV
ncbi:MAG TPA: hypothetical protein VF756_25315 [Thermoanaerobaculia bacterium]